jgi:hypothetical protein
VKSCETIRGEGADDDRPQSASVEKVVLDDKVRVKKTGA